MERKILGQGLGFDSVKAQMLRIIRSIVAPRTLSASTCGNESQQQLSAYSPEVAIKEQERRHEIETQKALLIHESRHQSWKGGGPV